MRLGRFVTARYLAGLAYALEDTGAPEAVEYYWEQFVPASAGLGPKNRPLYGGIE
jgi:hypothetical protein